jgi:hypothetical protein
MTGIEYLLEKMERDKVFPSPLILCNQFISFETVRKVRLEKECVR